MKILSFGAFLIGILTAISGFPIYDNVNGFSIKNLIILILCEILWYIGNQEKLKLSKD